MLDIGLTWGSGTWFRLRGYTRTFDIRNADYVFRTLRPRRIEATRQ